MTSAVVMICGPVRRGRLERNPLHEPDAEESHTWHVACVRPAAEARGMTTNRTPTVFRNRFGQIGPMIRADMPAIVSITFMDNGTPSDPTPQWEQDAVKTAKWIEPKIVFRWEIMIKLRAVDCLCN